MTDKKVILYAEDDKGLRDATERTLRRSFPEYTIETVNSGDSLEKRLNNGIEDVALVITDNEMPGVRGAKIIELYAKKEGFRRIPFILFYGGDDIIGKVAVENGAFSYVLKPLKIEDLFPTVSRALQHSEITASLQ